MHDADVVGKFLALIITNVLNSQSTHEVVPNGLNTRVFQNP